jgi:16S rRNA (guanine527-N7)-methyltransferase
MDLKSPQLLTSALTSTAGALSLAPAPAAAAEPLGRWLALLREWNARIDLTAARSDDELADLMLADAQLLASLEADGAPVIAIGARVVDIGSGAGAPGLALALMRPDLHLTLVEPLAKRAAFLRTVLGSLGRTDVTLVRGRGEDSAKKGRAFDVAISRATLPPAAWVPLGLALAPTSWVLLAREEPPSVAGAAADVDVSYVWPRTNAARRAVRYSSL